MASLSDKFKSNIWLSLNNITPSQNSLDMVWNHYLHILSHQLVEGWVLFLVFKVLDQNKFLSFSVELHHWKVNLIVQYNNCRCNINRVGPFDRMVIPSNKVYLLQELWVQRAVLILHLLNTTYRPNGNRVCWKCRYCEMSILEYKMDTH